MKNNDRVTALDLQKTKGRRVRAGDTVRVYGPVYQQTEGPFVGIVLYVEGSVDPRDMVYTDEMYGRVNLHVVDVLGNAHALQRVPYSVEPTPGMWRWDWRPQDLALTCAIRPLTAVLRQRIRCLRKGTVTRTPPLLELAETALAFLGEAGLIDPDEAEVGE